MGSNWCMPCSYSFFSFHYNRCTSININMVGFGVHNILSAQERTIGDALVAGTTLWTSTAGVRSYTRKWSPVPYDGHCTMPVAEQFTHDMDEVPMPAFVPAFEGDKPVIGRAMRSRPPFPSLSSLDMFVLGFRFLFGSLIRNKYKTKTNLIHI